MKKSIAVILLVFAVLFIAGAGVLSFVHAQGQSQPQQVLSNKSDGQAGQPLITYDSLADPDHPLGKVAHAGGTVDGKKYTNSLEAFQESYAKGFRLFELDFVRLKDGTVMVAHDGYERSYGLKKLFAESTAQDVNGSKMDGKYTVLFADDVIRLLHDYPDAYIILDTKMEHEKIVATLVQKAQRDPALLDRVIPHVSDQRNVDKIKAVYPFKHSMLALYRLLTDHNYTDDEIISYIHKNNITAVMLWYGTRDEQLTNQQNARKKQLFSPAFFERLNAERIPMYVHSIDSKITIDAFRRMGVGVYSDGVW